MLLETLRPGELPELIEFFRSIGQSMPPENLEQFCSPREEAGVRISVLVMREAGRIVGTIGCIDVPFRAGTPPAPGAPDRARWPINIYLAVDRRGHGLGRDLMEATREGADLRLVIGGNDASIPVLEKTGWKLVGRMSVHRWVRPCLDPRRLSDRLSRGARRPPPEVLELRMGSSRVVCRRVRRLQGWLPWAGPQGAPPAGERGVPRDVGYLAFAFSGPLRAFHALHAVDVDGALSGFFVLSARSTRRGFLSAEIVDLDASPGREEAVLRAARRTALSCADVARLRISGARFIEPLRRMSGGRPPLADLPLRISCRTPELEAALLEGGIDRWRLAYGDHDQYRRRGGSLPWGS